MEKELRSLYEKADSWKDFAAALHEKYDRTELCRKIAPWYISAVAIITDMNMIPEYWQIDISKIQPILYTRINSTAGSKTRKHKYLLPNQEHFILSPSELYEKIL